MVAKLPRRRRSTGPVQAGKAWDMTAAAAIPAASAPPLVDVLLATFDGAAFLGAQLDSLAGQTYPRLRVLIADDGSRDESRAIVGAYAGRDPRFTLIDNPRPGRGAAANFAFLLDRSRAPY